MKFFHIARQEKEDLVGIFCWVIVYNAQLFDAGRRITCFLPELAQGSGFD